MPSFPRYADLKRPDGLPLANGVWGPDDQIGTLNHITPAKAAEASRLVSEGKRFNLDLPLHLPFGGIKPKSHARRRQPEPTLFAQPGMGLLTNDDKLDEFFLQGSSQWDGLTHIGDPTYGFYNGVTSEQVTHGEGGRNGIELVAEHCIFTRGVLADLPRYFEAIGEKWAPVGSYVCTAKQLAACLEWQKVKVTPGDILLVRTGWVGAYLASDEAGRQSMYSDRKYSGLSGGEDIWEFLWDNKLAAVATDNVAVEVIPRVEGEAHLHWAIARIGITLGELFALDELAEACAQRKRYDFLFVSKPLNLRGGVGSPPNAMAVW